MQKRVCIRGQVNAIFNTTESQSLGIALLQPAKVETQSK